MKKVIVTILALGTIGFQSFAQDKKEEKHEIRVIVKTDDDGTETVVDTVINFSELEARIEAIDIDAIVEEMADGLGEGWDEVADKLQDLNLDLKVNGKDYELGELEDVAEWIGEAMEGVSFELGENQEHIFISCDGHDKGKIHVVLDENSEDGILVEEGNVSVNLDEDGKGNIIVKSIGTDGNTEDLTVWIEDDGNVVVNGGSGSSKATANVKVMKLEDGELIFSDEDMDDIDVKVITDKSGNSEATVLVKKIVRSSSASYKDAPELPNGLTLQVYPNPNNGQFQLTFRNDKKLKTSAVIYDSKGTEVYRNLFGKVDGLNKEQLDLTHLRSGSYILKLEQGKSTASEQFVIR